MSSKSKQHGRKGPRNPKGRGSQAEGPPGASPAAGAPQGVAGDEDELVHVPKGTNPLRFVLMIALIIVLLVIFIVPSALMGTFGRTGAEDTVYVGWQGPDGEEVELGGLEFQQEKRLVAAAIQFDPLLASFVSKDGRNVEDEDLARFLVLERLAVESGLHVSDADLRAHLLQLANLAFQGVSNYQRILQSHAASARLRSQDVEATIRRLLRARRYPQVAGLLTSVPDPARIEELWNESHEEVRLEFAALEADALEDDARAELPDDEALALWYEELSPVKKRELEVPEERSAELVSFLSAEETPAAGLLERFPAEETPEGEEPLSEEERTRQYYDQVYFWHFLQPAEGDEEDEGRPSTPQYRSFEEVQEVAAAEAPVFFAMQRWLASLREAQQAAAAEAPGAEDAAQPEEGAAEDAGEDAEAGSEEDVPPAFAVDLEAEAEALGLSHQRIPLTTREGWRALEEHQNVGDTLATRVFQTNAGDFTYSIVPRGDALSVVRVDRVEPARMPPFEDVRDRVAELWVEERAKELVTERLEELRAGLAAEPLEGEADHEEVPGQEHDHRYAGAEDFRAAAEAVGATYGTRTWFDKGGSLVPNDPSLDQATNEFFRRQRRMAAMDDDEVGRPTFDQKGERAYVVRLAERRPVPIERMSPAVLEQLEARAAQERQVEVLSQPSFEFLERQFGLYFARSPLEEEPAEDAAAEQGSGETSEG